MDTQKEVAERGLKGMTQRCEGSERLGMAEHIADAELQPSRIPKGSRLDRGFRFHRPISDPPHDAGSERPLGQGRRICSKGPQVMADSTEQARRDR